MRQVLLEAMSVRARHERKESTNKSQSRHLPANARVIGMTTATIGPATETVMIKKDPKGLVFCDRRRLLTSIDTFLEAVCTAARAPKRARPRETRKDPSIVSVSASVIVNMTGTVIEIEDETAETTDLTKRCVIGNATVQGIGSEAVVLAGEIATNGIVAVVIEVTIGIESDAELLSRLIDTFPEGSAVRYSVQPHPRGFRCHPTSLCSNSRLTPSVLCSRPPNQPHFAHVMPCLIVCEGCKCNNLNTGRLTTAMKMEHTDMASMLLLPPASWPSALLIRKTLLPSKLSGSSAR